jgi:multidrug transporter EmrE-like cation transporter
MDDLKMATNTDSLLVAPVGGQPTVAAPSRITLPWWVPFVASTIFVTMGHSLIKAGLNAGKALPAGTGAIATILHILFQPAVFGGLTIYLLGTICWMAAVAEKEISFLYPLTSVNYVFVVAISAVYFHEFISMRRGVGVALIVAGVILINRKSREVSA